MQRDNFYTRGSVLAEAFRPPLVEVHSGVLRSEDAAEFPTS